MSDPYQLPLAARPLRMLSAEGIAAGNRWERWRNARDREDAQPDDGPTLDYSHARPNPDTYPDRRLPGDPEDCNPSRYFPEDR